MYYLIYKSVGLTFYSLTTCKTNKAPITRKTDIVFCVVLIIGMLSSLYAGIKIHLKVTAAHNYTVIHIFFNILIVTNTTGVLGLLTSCNFQCRRLIGIVLALDDFDEKLKWLTESRSLYLPPRGLSFWITCFRYATMLSSLLASVATFESNVYKVLTYINLANYYIFYTLCMHCSCMYIFFICESSKRVRCINNYVERLLSANRVISCIETKILPSPNFPYKIDEVRIAVCNLTNIVSEINKAFQIQLLIKLSIAAISFLWTIYYIINTATRGFSVSEIILININSVVWAVLTMLDFAVDIYVYSAFANEVSMLNVH